MISKTRLGVGVHYFQTNPYLFGVISPTPAAMNFLGGEVERPASGLHRTGHWWHPTHDLHQTMRWPCKKHRNQLRNQLKIIWLANIGWSYEIWYNLIHFDTNHWLIPKKCHRCSRHLRAQIKNVALGHWRYRGWKDTGASWRWLIITGQQDEKKWRNLHPWPRKVAKARHLLAPRCATMCHVRSALSKTSRHLPKYPLVGKSTISMAIFNCYVSSPEGTENRRSPVSGWHCKTWDIDEFDSPWIPRYSEIEIHRMFVSQEHDTMRIPIPSTGS